MDLEEMEIWMMNHPGVSFTTLLMLTGDPEPASLDSGKLVLFLGGTACRSQRELLLFELDVIDGPGRHL